MRSVHSICLLFMFSQGFEIRSIAFITFCILLRFTNQYYSFTLINMKKEVLLYPRERRYLTEVGKQIRLARLRRRISCDLCAERAKISRATLWKIEKGDPSVSIEKGDPSVSMGAYLSVLFALRLERDILLLAREDQMGHEMQDQRLLIGKR